jgi:predicted Rossmann-fold nucleotide-binding protein
MSNVVNQGARKAPRDLAAQSGALRGEPSARPGRHVLVFCASSGSCAPSFHEAAASLGRALARAGDTLVYGGGAVGSMGALANAALAEGGRVIGVIPRFMRPTRASASSASSTTCSSESARCFRWPMRS